MPSSLDHLILFVPCSSSTNLPIVPHSIQKNFTLTPGGTHADGLTSNTLILLSDGCYIELISFLPHKNPVEKIKQHWWGPDVSFHGWKDWCLTTKSSSAEENYSRLKERGESHAEPIQGARKRADGELVQWSVTFPKGELGGQSVRGKLPFFCHDRTERDIRVPLREERTRHACGAVGVQSLTVIVKEEELAKMTGVYEEVLGVKGEEGDGEVRFDIERVVQPEGVKGGPVVVLRGARSEGERKKLEEKGFWYGDVVLATKGGMGKTRLDEGDDDMGGLWI